MSPPLQVLVAPSFSVALGVPFRRLHAGSPDLRVEHAIHGDVVVEERHGLAPHFLPDDPLPRVGIRRQEHRQTRSALDAPLPRLHQIAGTLDVVHDDVPGLQHDRAALLREDDAGQVSPPAVDALFHPPGGDVGFNSSGAQRPHVRCRGRQKADGQPRRILPRIPVHSSDPSLLIVRLVQRDGVEGSVRDDPTLGHPQTQRHHSAVLRRIRQRAKVPRLVAHRVAHLLLAVPWRALHQADRDLVLPERKRLLPQRGRERPSAEHPLRIVQVLRRQRVQSGSQRADAGRSEEIQQRRRVSARRRCSVSVALQANERASAQTAAQDRSSRKPSSAQIPEEA
eukprot:scaffold2952_cov312-Pinguiococcus_pyrenoidosus.AAC.26